VTPTVPATNSPDNPGESSDALKRAALVIAALSSFLAPFMVSGVNVALPAIGDEFQMGAVMLSWVNTSYLLAATVFLVPFGRLADLYGRKKIFGRHKILQLRSALDDNEQCRFSVQFQQLAAREIN
jgi:hypothetical protein